MTVLIVTNAALEKAATDAGFPAILMAGLLKPDESGRGTANPMEVSPKGRSLLKELQNQGKQFVLVSTDIPQDVDNRLRAQVALRPVVSDFKIRDVPFQDETGITPESIQECLGTPTNRVRPSPILPAPESSDPFPLVALPDPVRGIVLEVATAIDCDPSGPALAALVTAAAAIGATVRVKILDGWTPPVSLFGLILGYSGSRKSAMFRPFVAPFKRLHKQRLDAYREQLADFEAQEECFNRARARASKQGAPENLSKPIPPTFRQIYLEDTTIPALSRILGSNPRGCLVFRDELAGWLNSFEQFKDRGGSDLQSWIGLFNCDSLSINRKTDNEHIFVDSPFVAVLGGIQQPILKRVSKPEHAESGLLHRILMVRPERRKKRWRESGIREETVRRWGDIVARLFEIPFRINDDGHEVPNLIPFTQEGKAALVAFLEKLYRAQDELDEADPKIAYLSRLEELTPRLAGVLHVVETVGNGLTTGEGISLVAVESAIELIEWFIRERKRIENELALSQEDLADRALVAFLKTGPKTARDFGQFKKEFRNEQNLNAVLLPLEAAGLGSWQDVPAVPGGRRARRFILHEASTPATLKNSDP